MHADASPSSLSARLEAHANSRGALAIAFFWGFAEATVFFIVPDVYLGLIVLFNWRRGFVATACFLAGAMTGGAVLFILAAHDPAGTNRLLLSIPLIHIDMLNSVRAQLQSDGLIAMVLGPKDGIPYKVYAAQAGIQGLSLMQFVALTIPARLERVLPEVLAEALCGIVLRGFFRRHAGWIVGIYAYVWVCIYAAYTLRFR